MLDSVQAIDERIRDLVNEHELRDLRAQRNAFAPLCRLPVEVFVKILREYCSSRDLLAISTLCQSIRNTTHSQHTLWSRPPLAHAGIPDELAQLFIRRSGNALLTFTTNPFRYRMESYSSEQLECIASHLHRTKRLQMAVKEDVDVTAFMQSLHGAPSELMEQLSLSGEMEQLYLNGEIKTSCYLEITSALCGGQPRCLTSLTLKDIYLLGLPHTPSLRKLELLCVHCDYKVLRACLLSVNQLQQLRLGSLHLNHDNPSAVDPVELPCLQELCLGLYMSHALMILDLLPNPHTYFDLCVYISNSLVPAISPGDPTIQKAFSRSAQFWTSASEQSNYVTGVCRSCFYPFGDLLSAHSIEFGRSRHNFQPVPPEESNIPGVYFSIRVTDLLTNTEYIPLITDMHISVQDRDGDRKIQLDNSIDFDLCTGVERLELHIEVPWSSEASWQSRGALQELDKWIRKRNESGKPFASVCFLDCTPSIQLFFESLRDSQAARCVKWEDIIRD
jgi:hypothetical protein